MLGAIALQSMACGFPRPADVEPDTSSTSPLCGNLKIDPGEECDDGNTVDDGNGCDNQCRRNAICGDSKIQRLFEICDGTIGCSPDCKEISILSFPADDRHGRYDGTAGTWGLFPDNAETGDVTWLAPADGGPFEFRTALEFDTHFLLRTDLLKTASLVISPTALPQQPHILQLHGYYGDGTITIKDMSTDNLIRNSLTEKSGVITFDIASFAKTATDQQYPFTGFLLRVDTPAPADPSWGIIVALSENPNSNLRPRLEITYCLDSNQDDKCD